MIEESPEQKLKLKDYIVLMLKGFCMGIADLIPGISGGTIALIVGIYEDLVEATMSFNGHFFVLLGKFKFKDAFASVAWHFLGTVILGILTAVFTLSGIIRWLLVNHPILLNSFFFGLILASIPLIAKRIKKWPSHLLASSFMAAVAMYFIAGLIPIVTPTNPFFIFFCGAVAICAMILPGISGSFILLLLGKYQFIIESIHDREIVILLIFGMGCIVGLLSFVRVLNWLLHKYHDVTVAVLIGLVIGSLRKIWPWKISLETIISSSGKIIPIKEVNVLPQAVTGELVFAVILIVCGFAAAYLLKLIAGEDYIKN